MCACNTYKHGLIIEHSLSHQMMAERQLITLSLEGLLLPLKPKLLQPNIDSCTHRQTNGQTCKLIGGWRLQESQTQLWLTIPPLELKRLDRKETTFRNVWRYSPLGRWSKHTSIPTKMTNLARFS